MGNRFDTLPDEPAVICESEPARGFPDEPTARAETRTVKLAELAPWYDAPPREPKKREGLLVPVLIFVTRIASAIGYTLATQSPHRPTSVQVF